MVLGQFKDLFYVLHLSCSIREPFKSGSAKQLYTPFLASSLLTHTIQILDGHDHRNISRNELLFLKTQICRPTFSLIKNSCVESFNLMVKSNQFLVSPIAGNFSGHHSISWTGFHFCSNAQWLPNFIWFFSPREAFSDNTPRQGFDSETPSTFSHHYCRCAFSSWLFWQSSHAYKIQTQHQQTTGDSSYARTHSYNITFILQTLGDPNDFIRLRFSGVKNFVTIFKMLPKAIKIWKFPDQKFPIYLRFITQTSTVQSEHYSRRYEKTLE